MYHSIILLPKGAALFLFYGVGLIGICYTIPLFTSIVSSLIWRKKKTVKTWRLNLLLYGGATFGVIDHLWNRELFLMSENPWKDLALGVVITVAVFILWGIISAISKKIAVLQEEKV
ncbi:MAG: hypothetical protein QMD71_05110 [bacterium]|nr:hypothetical protein [bacterium]